MTKKEKLWRKALNSPQNLTFKEFETLLEQYDWNLVRQRGSHRLWSSPKGQALPIQPRKDSKAKTYQVQQFIKCQQENK
ncbi:MAG: type II toxin-antitoxin system HicA family toxin [Cyanobacteria bacterium J06600_6]